MSTQEFFTMVNQNDINGINRILDEGIDVNISDEMGNTLLIQASLQGRETIVTMLIAAGANINFKNNRGSSALSIATSHISIISELILAGANVNNINDLGDTPLINATRHGKKEAVELLLEAEADVTLVNEHGMTALLYAIAEGYTEIELLLRLSGAQYDNEEEEDLDEYIYDFFPNFACFDNDDEDEDNEDEDNDEDEDIDDEDIDEYDEEEAEEDLHPFTFENTEDIDERNMTFETCHDIYMNDKKNITFHLNETDTFLFINKQPNNDVFDMFCFEKSYIQNILNNKNDNWFYECNGLFLADKANDRSMSSFVNFPYIKIPLDIEGLNGFIPLNQIRSILRSNNKVYYIYPFLLNGEQKMLTHSVSWQNSYGPSSRNDFVSANHCQSGSSILIYNLKVCRDPERCVRSILE